MNHRHSLGESSEAKITKLEDTVIRLTGENRALRENVRDLTTALQGKRSNSAMKTIEISEQVIAANMEKDRGDSVVNGRKARGGANGTMVQLSFGQPKHAEDAEQLGDSKAPSNSSQSQSGFAHILYASDDELTSFPAFPPDDLETAMTEVEAEPKVNKETGGKRSGGFLYSGGTGRLRHGLEEWNTFRARRRQDPDMPMDGDVGSGFGLPL